jgi:SAM-dependent methyltransferase
MIESIKNYNVYTQGMSKSYQDKLFFLDKINDVTGLVDFGCADGTLIEHIADRLPNVKLVGYDINQDMIQLAMEKDKTCGLYTNDFNEAMRIINTDRSVLNLSSVIHEVYSYSMPYAINEFWNNVFNSGFQYIVIRDFCVSASVNRKADVNDWTKVIQKADVNQVTEYESIWGSIRENRNLVHFLMKYRYVTNWEREVRENYFPITLERLLSKVPTDKYEIIYFEDYVLPFIANKVKEDFGIHLHDSTHVKLLLRSKHNTKKCLL